MTLVLSILFGSLWGTVQGIIMIQRGDYRAVPRAPDKYVPDGPRNHQWFRFYHTLNVCMMLAWLALFVSWYMTRPDVIFLLGCVLIGWESSELWYSFSRFGICVPNLENITILDIWNKVISKKYVRYIHAVRVTAGILLLIIGS